MEVIKVIVSWQENYGASSVDVPGCVALHDDLEELKKAYESALEFHIEGLESKEVPEKLKGAYKLEFELDTHALLNHFKGIITFSAISKVSGINEKQLGHYAQGHRSPRPKQRERIIEAINKIGRDMAEMV